MVPSLPVFGPSSGRVDAPTGPAFGRPDDRLRAAEWGSARTGTAPWKKTPPRPSPKPGRENKARHKTCYPPAMLTYVLRRILATIPVMAVVALFVFSLLYIAPGDPAAVIAGDQASPADVARIRATLGLDRPFLVRFGEWVWLILHGDLGTSIFTNLPVAAMIGQRIEPTLSLMA